MRKILYFLLCLLCSVSITANVVTGVAAIPANYYSGVDGKKGADNILNALQTCISRNYNEISYKGLEIHYLNTDFYADTLWDVYSTCRFVYDDANKAQSMVCDGWNKEHVCCQSWLGSGPMVSDMFNVYPTDARVNNLRSNYPYGVVGTNKGFSGDPDHHALGKLGTSSKAGYSGTCYEPDDQYKGDLARTFFYMVARYRDNILNSGYGSNMFTSNPTNLTSYSLSFLLDWHRNDPVSEKEIDRNQGVYGEQNNRNPFIDYPDLVEYIWGDKVGQTVDLSSMTPTCESITQVTKYGVTWKVNGEVLKIDSVRAGNRPASLPAEPTSCSETSESFYGWAGGSWEGVLPDYLPADIDEFSNIAYMPAVVFDVTFHAVFAHKEVTSTGQVERSETINMKAQGYGNGSNVTTVTQGDVTITFAKGTAQTNTPKYYTTGEAVRCYPGNTMTVSAQGMTKIFTVGGSSSNRRFAEVAVTVNGSGLTTTYSDYLTSCNATQTLVHHQASKIQNQKLLINGRLYIRVGDHTYTVTGQKIN